MKLSHLQTPRTLAECTFVVGYPLHDRLPTTERPWRMASVVYWSAVAIVVSAVIGFLLGTMS
jgi:hypothetical protein